MAPSLPPQPRRSESLFHRTCGLVGAVCNQWLKPACQCGFVESAGRQSIAACEERWQAITCSQDGFPEVLATMTETLKCPLNLFAPCGC